MSSPAATILTRPVTVGVVGCGKISDVYLRNLSASTAVEVVACADLLPERARLQAEAHGVPHAYAVEELLADPAIELVLNLTVPAAHAQVALAAVEAGKSVYNEKPLAVERQAAARLLARAVERGVLVGGAPDTFLGVGLRTCRALIDDGAIGEPVAVTAALRSRGPEGWHPAPEFFYLHGGGPLLDMGPYYLTALVAMLGPIARVTGAARASFPTRRVTSQPGPPRDIPVEVPTHVAATLEFAAGPIGTLVTSFDVWTDQGATLEIAGSEATLRLPDPNTFGGPVALLDRAGRWSEVPLLPGPTTDGRGLGVIDLAGAIRSGAAPRAGGNLAYHVLDVMHAVLESAVDGRRLEVASTCARPAP